MKNLKSGNVWLWVLQVLLAVFFAAASGAPKWLLPPDVLAQNMAIELPRAFVLFIGACEILGAIGLLVQRTTRVAAVCLVALTLCATTYQLLANQPGSAVFALVMGALCALVVYGRRGRSARSRESGESAAAAAGSLSTVTVS